MFSSQNSQVSSDANYIEDVFQTWLYTGNGSTQTITNGIDLAGKGGLIWTKARSLGNPNVLVDTARGARYGLFSNTTNANVDYGSPSTGVVSFGSTGYPIGSDGSFNSSGSTYASWTFREQPKFFDVVTYTGTGSARTVAHNLGATPGCIIVKAYSGTNAGIRNWIVYHRSVGATGALTLNETGATSTASAYWNDTAPTSTQFTVNTDGGVNSNGVSYVAYLFAHNAGGFGLTGTDNVISCGSFTTDSSGNATVNLGYEPQWILTKTSSATDSWVIVDSMRGNSTLNGTTNTEQVIYANSSAAELSAFGYANPTSTGFVASGWGSTINTHIYIAIRRGPMKVPTSGTSVFDADAYTGNSTARVITTGFPSDLNIMANRTSDGLRSSVWDRLRGFDKFLATSNTGVETTYATEAVYFDNNSGYGLSTSTSQGLVNFSGYGGYVGWAFRRAPSFFDEVCYTGTGANQTLSHNLQAVPELIIVKNRSGIRDWGTGWASIGWGGRGPALNSNEIAYASVPTWWNSTAPTASVFTVGSSATTNGSGSNFVAYLFATCAGVSKVGSYTGNGSSQTINCGFTGGARFVLIKRTDSTGDWYVWDSARGIVAGNDPHLSLNTSSAEVTTDDTIDTNSTGFVVNQVVATNVNVTSATYIFLAIA